MDFRIVVVGVAVGMTALTATLVLSAFSAPTGPFSFPSPGGKGDMNYTCALRSSPAESEANALAAHRFHVASISEMEQSHAGALIGIVSNYSNASDSSGKLSALRNVDELGTTIAANRKSLDKELRRLFGCKYVPD